MQILDAIHSDSADFQRMADIIRHDTAMAARLVAVANSSYYNRASPCTTVERALMFLGTDAVKTIVITAAIKQFFSDFSTQNRLFLQHFWKRSLIAANFAKVLATLTSYSAPEEAYFCGLLSDVGQLILLARHDRDYQQLLTDNPDDTQLIEVEQQQYSTDHCSLGGDLANGWLLSDFMADALRYHHESPLHIRDAHHLVKVINLSNRLSASEAPSEQALEAADTLFGLNEALTIELRQRINSDVLRLAQTLGIDIEANEEESDRAHAAAHQQLGERLSELGEIAHLSENVWLTDSETALQNAIERSIYLTFGASDLILFTTSPNQQQLSSRFLRGTNEPQDTFVIGLEPGRSLVADATLESTFKHSNLYDSLSIVDRQMLRHCKADTLLAWPLAHNGQRVGVLVMGIMADQLDHVLLRSTIADGLFQHIAARLLNYQRSDQAVDTQLEATELRIREAVHEIGNPISIIRNYLETLRHKLSDDDSALEDLDFIREEMERLGNIMLRLRQPEAVSISSEQVDINAMLNELAEICRDTLCVNKNISIELQLDNRVEVSHCHPAQLRQVLINLLKNAVEALSPGGEITLGSEAQVTLGNQQYNVIFVADNGPGINAGIKQHLFTPVVSTKGDGHSGLGLSIVKKLVDEMGGNIVCRSNGTHGTLFQILLPL